MVLQKISGPLMSFGSLPSFQPTPSFWKEPMIILSRGSPRCFLAAIFSSGVGG